MTTLVFVHGWSATTTGTYGSLPAALKQHADARGSSFAAADIYLSEFVTFVDTVTMDDLVRAFDSALRALSLSDARFDCITHSTGALVIREWVRMRALAPASFSAIGVRHLVMLAPANFGSALAQLGKSRVGRLRAWWNGVEPGQRILDWLELGSEPLLALNLAHIHGADPLADGIFMYVLSGDRPDRSLYDHLNAYTGEDGSDGVVRLAAANLNATHVQLVQHDTGGLVATTTRAPRTAFRLVPGAAHSGEHGIMAATATMVDLIAQCLAVRTKNDYLALTDAFDEANHLRDAQRIEREPAGLFDGRIHMHDPRSMVTVRLRDDRGEPLHEGEFLWTAHGSADLLPRGFMLDRQANPYDDTVITMFLNYAVLAGDNAVFDEGHLVRQATPGRRPYGVAIRPANASPLVAHSAGTTDTHADVLPWLGPHRTTVIDVVLKRKVHEGVFRLHHGVSQDDFSDPVIGPVISGR
jgi:hypothetical protein